MMQAGCRDVLAVGFSQSLTSPQAGRATGFSQWKWNHPGESRLFLWALLHQRTCCRLLAPVASPPGLGKEGKGGPPSTTRLRQVLL